VQSAMSLGLLYDCSPLVPFPRFSFPFLYFSQTAIFKASQHGEDINPVRNLEEQGVHFVRIIIILFVRHSRSLLWSSGQIPGYRPRGFGFDSRRYNFLRISGSGTVSTQPRAGN
jgi:hypothetical protein